MRSNNTNKFNPQERMFLSLELVNGSNNTNKFNPQELTFKTIFFMPGSNNTNKFNPQEQNVMHSLKIAVQIIQINSILKNKFFYDLFIRKFK